MDYITLNLKENYPSVNLAVGMLEVEIDKCRKGEVRAIKVIHGYGSHGTGGEIKRALRQWFRMAKRSGKICEFCAGEQWNGNGESVFKIKQECPNVLGDSDLFYSNPGITIVLI